VVAVLTPRGDGMGWHIEDASGNETGSLRVKDDRVTVKDADDRRLGKVKIREHGFKIEDGNDQPLFRLERDDEGYRIERGDADAGSYRGARIELGGAAIEARPSGDAIEVRRDGALLYSVRGPIAPDAAVFLGLSDELSFEQRLAAMIFVREVSFR
jgi:hypothetical protein